MVIPWYSLCKIEVAMESGAGVHIRSLKPSMDTSVSPPSLAVAGMFNAGGSIRHGKCRQVVR